MTSSGTSCRVVSSHKMDFFQLFSVENEVSAGVPTPLRTSNLAQNVVEVKFCISNVVAESVSHLRHTAKVYNNNTLTIRNNIVLHKMKGPKQVRQEGPLSILRGSTFRLLLMFPQESKTGPSAF